METKKNEATETLKISEEVIAQIAKCSAKEVKGFGSFSAGKASVKELAFKSDAKSPVKITLSGDVAQIDLSLTVKPGAKIKEVCENIQSTVKADVQSMTNVMVSKVNIFVTGISE